MLMSTCENDKPEDRIQMMTRTEQFSKLLCELEHCREDEQMQKIEKMNEMAEEMKQSELESIFSEEQFNEIDKMIEEKKITMENACLLLKRIGYNFVLKFVWNRFFETSLLIKRFEAVMIEEYKKKEGRNEKLLVDLCESYLTLSCSFLSELLVICILVLLKVASKKEETEETQKEVEMALLALNRIDMLFV
ncbi:uncharacterized protein MONOS_10076 [Monocercomonoides exilis]|uniref:uncharacterized protein n=1 Tax=Monocercomonoides exilis TaxID=2049356 RepID=UPI00355A1B68|nr:hypothetical protein MONOS_10076 [Monocercomonoides exilis]|eukprot:MONOS_10076.1-p1 / transcript=MONOS_10076.1 / gene=MONOS_10076 / organism=Monocercomonoides_exilis_PA203 / gene_product=unspecified product / transcript_product=unspecified product / location=Mono_scaffold00442:22620-23334(-) / protein_length=192 / sequence_SO=supercontig / SO=protein_coding / is_pseudo=false